MCLPGCLCKLIMIKAIETLGTERKALEREEQRRNKEHIYRKSQRRADFVLVASEAGPPRKIPAVGLENSLKAASLYAPELRARGPVPLVPGDFTKPITIQPEEKQKSSQFLTRRG